LRKRKGHTSVRIRLYNYLNTGWVAFDDVSFKVSGDDDNLVPNPGFEGGSGWSEHGHADFPGTSFLRGTSGIADQRSGSYGYAISNLAYGYLESHAVSVRPNHEYDLYAYVRQLCSLRLSTCCESPRSYTNLTTWFSRVYYTPVGYLGGVICQFTSTGAMNVVKSSICSCVR
jgi:hypothetical protein